MFQDYIRQTSIIWYESTIIQFKINSPCLFIRISLKVYHCNFTFHHNVRNKVFLSEQKGNSTFISLSFSIPQINIKAFIPDDQLLKVTFGQVTFNKMKVHSIKWKIYSPNAKQRQKTFMSINQSQVFICLVLFEILFYFTRLSTQFEKGT